MRVFAIAFLVAACATTSAVSLKPQITFRDAPEDGRIYLSIRNDFEHAICLYPTNWPDASGVIEQAADRAWIEVGGRRFTMTDLDAGYCPGCRKKIPPGKSVTAFVNYGDFRLPEAVRWQRKRLLFQPEAQPCH